MYLTILADQGLIGLGLFLLILWRSLRFIYGGLPRMESPLHRADLSRHRWRYRLYPTFVGE